MKERLDYLDMVKGIGIWLVVIGHSTYVSDELLTWLTSFHMPLFFIISGILFAFKKSYYESTSAFIKKRFFGMMVPYIIFTIIYIGVDIYYHIYHPELMTERMIRSALLQSVSLYGTSVLWFLPTLFFSELLLLIFMKKYAALKDRTELPFGKNITNNRQTIFENLAGGLARRYLYISKKWIFVLTMIVSGVIPLAGMPLVSILLPDMQENLFQIWFGYLLMAFFRLFGALALLMAGYAVYFFLKKITFQPAISIVAGCCLLLLNAAVAFANGRVDMHFLVFNNIFYFYLGAFSATLGLILIFRPLPKIRLLAFFGVNSLIVMLTHLDCQVLSNAIRFAVGIGKRIPIMSEGILFYLSLYGSIFIAEVVLIYVINHFAPWLIGKRYRK